MLLSNFQKPFRANNFSPNKLKKLCTLKFDDSPNIQRRNFNHRYVSNRSVLQNKLSNVSYLVKDRNKDFLYKKYTTSSEPSANVNNNNNGNNIGKIDTQLLAKQVTLFLIDSF
jgi:hypothetical protein